MSICGECGHIQLSPVCTPAETASINEKFLGSKYLKEGRPNPFNNDKKLARLEQGLSPFVKAGMKILDVGAGEAWMMGLARKWGVSYYAIEPIKKLADSITERGGSVIGDSISSEFQGYQSFFDIVVIRHVIEHLVDPLGALLKVKSLLKPDGIAYVAVPNASCFSTKKGLRTSFLRPAHISYFCPDNLVRLASRAGLEAVDVSPTSEIVCIARSSQKKEGVPFNNSYERQRRLFTEQLVKSAPRDFVKVMSIVLAKMLK